MTFSKINWLLVTDNNYRHDIYRCFKQFCISTQARIQKKITRSWNTFYSLNIELNLKLSTLLDQAIITQAMILFEKKISFIKKMCCSTLFA